MREADRDHGEVGHRGRAWRGPVAGSAAEYLASASIVAIGRALCDWS